MESDLTLPELRLVLLGRKGSGKSAAGNAILGREAFVSCPDSRGAVTQECEKKTATVAGRRVTIVDTPDWFYSEQPPEVVHQQISACVTLSSPGPHAFLLCIPLHRRTDTELEALEAVAGIFGPDAVAGRTLVLFTYADRLSESIGVEEYIVTRRKDLQKLVRRCGDRYHVLEKGVGAEEGETELLEKVEQMVRERGGSCYTCPPIQEAAQLVSPGKEEAVRERNKQGRGGKAELEQTLSSSSIRSERETEVEEEERESKSKQSGDETDEEVVEDLKVAAVASPPSSLIRSIWDKMVALVRRAMKMVTGSTFLGGLVGIFVGGPLGSALGATVGSVATEVGRRKKTKQ